MERDIYDEDHEAFRDLVKDFVKRHVTGEAIERWDAAGEIDRATMLAAGESGLIGLSVPEEFGGAGMLQDYRFRTIVMEEVIAAGAGSLAGAFGIQDDLAVPYLVHMGTQEQKEKWLPRMATGEVLGALAMTDPGAGSDLRGIKTSAKKVDGGYILNGAKTFISSGTTADVVVTFVKTGEGNRPDAFSLLLVEKGMEGFDQGKKLSKMGFHGWDTAELSFTDVFVPDENLISGKEGQGFIQLMLNLPLERLSIGVAAAAAAQAAFDWTVAYTKDREAFGERIADFQNTRFRLADMAATTDAMWAYIDRALLAYKNSTLTAEDAAKVKFWATEREWEVLDVGVQLHGGYGYIMEYPIARAFTDARVHRIYGGTNEIMRDLVGRQIAGKR
ncbi:MULTISPECIES: acyl-CoA dehydrogenase family protein [unclassified Microbacterium]|uniref:acyl-CoA dehydrogenase family protein n=1 Tax=unclassified Microbacterium TaxID=2609290 RepID=UPI000CFB5DC9|nr:MULTISPECIES: acyl-CoA dehydrogenase family protein [unclassified Microbacterium]PQZ54556.1 acyl-CoA dehydrogenase [Microbacterium sp. MYb43]PQZ74281.1 acyl-CoA dehydrogenase [Microbacterium sp. MYb40]PRB17120.1 acyl-CoA dehydrogenase [Microbacterium sp. MYb54]PRB25270.1 acyl-CoA dehydrogenase [Microbacterium sp. MYb50]PRB63775.1 acyl-CoA dehydrogenase [Microbacterium sp. MYb24]